MHGGVAPAPLVALKPPLEIAEGEQRQTAVPVGAGIVGGEPYGGVVGRDGVGVAQEILQDIPAIIPGPGDRGVLHQSRVDLRQRLERTVQILQRVGEVQADLRVVGRATAGRLEGGQRLVETSERLQGEAEIVECVGKR